MKRRIISMLLVLVLLLGVLPITAAAETADLTIDTGHAAEFLADRYLSQIVIKDAITGAVATGSGYNWNVVLPADTDTTQPLTLEMTASFGYATAEASSYFWACGTEDVVSTMAVANQNPGTVTVLPAWENGRAKLVVGLGSTSSISVSYNISLVLEGTPEDYSSVDLGETKSRKYFITSMSVEGAEVTASAVSDTDFSASTSGHKATVDFTLGSMPDSTFTLEMAFGATGTAYMTVNGSDRISYDSTLSQTIDLKEASTYVFVTYSTKTNTTVRGTYTVNFTVAGGTNAVPTLKSGVPAEAEATVYIPNSYTVELSEIFTDLNSDEMTYTVSVNGADAVEAAASYSFTPEATGTYTLVFRANDGKDTSTDTYTVTVTVPENNIPALTGEASAKADVLQFVAWTLNLEPLFTDADGDTLTYYAKVNDGSWTALSDSIYTYIPGSAGETVLTFKTNDGKAYSEEYTITLTVAENEVSYAVEVDQTVSNGSFDYLMITDTDGNVIEDADVSLDGTAVTVILPRAVGLTGKVKTIFGLTQNGMDGSIALPFLSTKTGTAGTTSERAVNNIVSSLTTTLSAGKATAAVYLYNSVPITTSNSYTTYPITYKLVNNAPVLTTNGAVTEDVVAGNAYTVDLSQLFTDADSDVLTYTVSVNGETAVAVDALYSYTPTVAGTETLVFTATDGIDTAESYTVTLNVTNSDVTYDVTIHVTEGLSPTFYATSGYDDSGVDVFSEADPLTAEVSGTTYTVKVPETVSTISFRDETWGGMSVAVSEGAELYLEAFSGYIDQTHDGAYVTAEQAQFLVKDNNNHYAVSGSSAVDEELGGVTYYRFLLAATGNDATYTLIAKGAGELADIYGETIQNVFALEPDGQTFAALSLTVSDPVYIIVPEGFEAALYRQQNNYNTVEIDSIAKVTADGLTTYTFKKPGSNLTWRAWDPTDETKITKAGYVGYSEDTITVTWDDTDPAADAQVNWSTDTEMALRHDATAVVNVNAQNHLVLSEGDTFRLRGFRWWQIIDTDVNNIMIEPDFHYEIITGSDLLSINATDGGNATGNRMDITANAAGMAVVEVGFDALSVYGMGYEDPDFVYGACDPDRTALVVVSVGENVIDADFGIVGTNNTAGWDVEFDTVYFLGSHGELTLTPAVSGTLSVSHDKGLTWQTLTSEDGTYTAPIVSGNNILKLETADGVDYQVVRGGKVTASLANITDGKDADAPIAAGDTVQITLDGLHHGMSKMSGIYNPGYGSGVTMTYSTYQGETFLANSTGHVDQYRILRDMTVTIPDTCVEGDVIDLTTGYIICGGMGSAAGAHRSIADAGVGTNTSASSSNGKYSRLPDMKLTVGGTTVEGGIETPVIEKFDIAGVNMTLGNELELNIMLPKETVDAYGKDLTVTVIHHEYVDGDTEYTFNMADLPLYGGSKYYKASIRVAAAQMTDLVDVVVTDSEGNVYNNDFTTSCLTYVTNNLDKQTAKVQTLLVDMVNYGAAAQDQFSYRQDLYANSNLTEAQKALATGDVECTDIRVKGDKYVGSNLSLQDQILLNFFFTGVTDDVLATMTAKIEFTGALGNEVSVTVPAQKMLNKYVGVAVNQIVLADSICPVTVTMLNADGSVYGYATDSVESYNARQNADGSNALYTNIMKFATSALAYKS